MAEPLGEPQPHAYLSSSFLSYEMGWQWYQLEGVLGGLKESKHQGTQDSDPTLKCQADGNYSS